MEKKKILLTMRWGGLGRSGVSAVLMSIVRKLNHKYIFDMLMFTNKKGYYEDEFLSYGGKIIRASSCEGASSFRKRADFYLRGPRIYKEVKKAIEENGPYQAIHCNNAHESALFVKAAKECGVPVRIAHIHAVAMKGNPVYELLNKHYVKLIKNHATHMIGCSKEACASVFGKDENFLVVSNPYDEERFCAAPQELAKNRPMTFVQIGSFSTNKNQTFSIHIVNEIKKKYPEVKLHIVGFDLGNYLQSMKKTVAELSLEQNVVIYPHDVDTPKLLEESAALLFPSVAEGFGIVLVEAQAMGVPCYVSDSVPKDADCGGCTFLPLSDGAQKWAEVICKDFERTNGRHEVYDCSRFTSSAICRIYDGIYEGKKI